MTAYPEPGTRYRLRRNVERFPHFTAPAGGTGTIVETSEYGIVLRMDAPLPGAEEWDNAVCWDDNWGGTAEMLAQFHADAEPVA